MSHERSSRHECECSKSEFEVTEPILKQVAAVKGYDEIIHPISSLTNTNVVEFLIQGTETFIDMSDIHVELQVQVKNADGTVLVEDADVVPINLWLDTLFKNVSISLKGKFIETSNQNHAYKSYLKHLLAYGADSKSNQLRAAGYIKEESGKMADKGANWFKKKMTWIAGSKTLQLYGLLGSDFFNTCDRLLLPMVDIGLKFTLNQPEFSIISHLASGTFSIELLSMKLYVRRIQANPEVAMSIERDIKKTNAIYPFTKVDVSAHSVAVGSRDVTLTNLFPQKKPKCIALAMVLSEGFNGSYTTNPFQFDHCHLNSLTLTHDGQCLTGSPLTPDFTNDQYAREYMMMFSSSNKLGKDMDMDLSFEDFKNGYTIYLFNLAADKVLEGNTMQNTAGNITCQIQFKKALGKAVNIVVWGWTDAVVQITGSRKIITEYE